MLTPAIDALLKQFAVTSLTELEAELADAELRVTVLDALVLRRRYGTHSHDAQREPVTAAPIVPSTEPCEGWSIETIEIDTLESPEVDPGKKAEDAAGEAPAEHELVPIELKPRRAAPVSGRSTPTVALIRDYLQANGPASVYDVSKALGLKYHTVYSAMNRTDMFDRQQGGLFSLRRPT